MTQNNYPEGLDELAKVILLKSGIGLYNTAKISGDELSSNFARALLDALAERGYVLVDTKQQEPVAYLKFWGHQWYAGHGNVEADTGYEVCANGDIGDDGKLAFPVYEHPAIPQPAAVPDGWKLVPVEPTFDMQDSHPYAKAMAYRIYRAMLSAAPTPPTQQQGDGSLRRDAERYRWLRDLDVDDPRCEIGNYPGHMWNDAIDAAMEASNGNA